MSELITDNINTNKNKKQRIPCFYCRYLQYDNEMLNLGQRNLRINRLIAQLRETWIRRICEAYTIIKTHPCSEEHRLEIKKIRASSRIPLQTLQRKKRLSLKISEERLKKVNIILMEMRLGAKLDNRILSREEELVLKRTELEKMHLERVVSQRRRRLNELYTSVQSGSNS